MVCFPSLPKLDRIAMREQETHVAQSDRSGFQDAFGK